MLALITKASDDYWYQFKEVNTLESLLKIADSLIVSQNTYTKDILDFWDGFKEEDIPKLEKAKIEIKIYDDYVE
jgi:hypothetical protein